LASFCSLCQDTVLQNQITIDNNEFVTISLLPEVQVQSDVNTTVEFLKSSASSGIISFLNYLRITTQANNLISALNTNAIIEIVLTGNDAFIDGFSTSYAPYFSSSQRTDSRISCSYGNPIVTAGFYSSLSLGQSREVWYLPSPNSTLVNGFFGGCTALESLLPSTLDCLYDIICLELLFNNIPALNQVCLILSYLSYLFFLFSCNSTGPTLFCLRNNKMLLFMII
jgi:hypothetical protein